MVWSDDEFDDINGEGRSPDGDDSLTWDKPIAVLDAVVCVVDVFAWGGNGDRAGFSKYLRGCCTALERLWLAKMISSPRDSLAICFAGTKEPRNEFGLPHIQVFQPLERPSVDTVLQLRRWSEDGRNSIQDDFFDAAGKIGICDDATASERTSALYNVLLVCCSQFGLSRAAASNKMTKRIFLFTARDDWGEHDSARLLPKMKDLQEMNAGLLLLKCTPNFDVRRSFQNLLRVANNETDEDALNLDGEDHTTSAAMSDEEMLANLQDRVLDIAHAQRRLSWCNIRCGTVVIGRWAAYVELRRTPSTLTKYKCQIDTMDVLHSKTAFTSNSTGARIDKYGIGLEFRHYAPDRPIQFTTREIQTIKQNRALTGGAASQLMEILGSKPQSALELHHCYRTPYLFVPERDPTSSLNGETIRATLSLIDALDSAKAFLVARLVLRAGSSPRLVALVPQKQMIDENQMLLQPAGFVCIFLPFKDDIRELPFTRACVPSDSLIKDALLYVDAMSIDAPWDEWQDPLLARHQSQVQAVALDLAEVPIPLDDHFSSPSIPDEAKSSAQHFLANANFSNKPVVSVKRQRRVEEDQDADGNMIQIEAGVTEAQLNSMTVADLKEWLRIKGGRSSGRKALLIERVLELLREDTE